MSMTKQTAVAAALALLGIAPAGAQQSGQRAPAVIKGTTQAKPVFVPQAVPQASSQTLPDGDIPSEIGPAMSLVVGKSTLVRLPAPIERISVGNPAVADVTLISARELYLLGKTFGSTNVIMWRRNAPTTIIDVAVGADSSALEQRLRALLPGEDIKVQSASDSLVLSGLVSSALKASQAVEIAESFVRTYSRGLQLQVMAGDQVARQGQAISVDQKEVVSQSGGSRKAQEPKVINMLRIAQPQQVMLEVKVAEVSKNLLDKLGVNLDAARVHGSWRYSILGNLLSDSAGLLGATSRTGNSVVLDAERRDGLIKVLAEPNIVAISGQEASFLAGGKIFIPVARENNATGGTTITLEEKEFGVGLKFTPVVLDGGRIHLKVAPEVSELSQTGSPFTTINGVTAVLPSFTTRRAQTSVQLMDGQSLAIAGLIKNNVTETVRRLPVLGELPVLGALFRSSEFQTDRTELMFLITPRLVKPVGPEVALPTDAFTPPSRSEFFLNGQLEGRGSGDVPVDHPVQQPPAAPAPRGAADAAPSAGGFSMK
ncbi:MAG: type II and III secretion system protein family protein [Burkholderiaceae bacterium]|nr:type II and III secretion system protein family protein [Burkholderiaceae bacterium]MEB2351485.1 type II and III secretion system protein family protein [Burkholderiaceae bacterium]